MGRCDNSLRLPIIDFSKENLKPGTKIWESTCNEVRKAFEECGCFEGIYGNNSSLELQNKLFEKVEKMFSLPSERKCRFTSQKPYYGYLGNVPDNPLYEAMGIDDALDQNVIQDFTDLVWPEANPQFGELLNEFTKKIVDFERMIRKMVLESLGVENLFDCQEKSTVYTLRLSKYEAPMTEDAQVGARSHYDKNFISILCENNVAGLEVQRRDGKWIRASLPASSFVVMTGESFHGWSNGRLHCPMHQVMMNGNKPRFSLGIFSSMKGIIQTPQELVDELHPLLFKPFDEIGLLKVLHRVPQEEDRDSAALFFADTSDLSLKSYSV